MIRQSNVVTTVRTARTPKNRQPSAAQIDATDPFIKAIGDYEATDLMKPSIQKPSPEIRAFLEQHATEIAALRDHLRANQGR